MKHSRTAIAATALLLASLSAHAVLTSTSPGCNTATLTPGYTACGGSFAGNDLNQQADVLGYIDSHFGGANMLIGASDMTANGPFTSNPDGTSGMLTFDSAIDGAFVLSLKAGDQFSLYYYDGSGPAISSISYSTIGTNLNSNGIPNGLSHASLYGGSVAAVPEPETYALMLAGLGAMGFLSKRRKA